MPIYAYIGGYESALINMTRKIKGQSTGLAVINSFFFISKYIILFFFKNYLKNLYIINFMIILYQLAF